MKTIPELSEAVLRLEDQRSKLGRQIGTVRIDLRNEEQMRHEAKAHDFILMVDEPPERGGTNMGLHPLGYFVLGCASCFLTQLARTTIIRNYKIDTLEMTALAHYDRGELRRFTDIVYNVRLTGSETKEKAIRLLHEAEERCFVHQTLKFALPLTSNLSLNGEDIASHTVGVERLS